MEIISLLHSKLNLARRVLRELTQDYMKLDDTQRLDKSNTIMDEINSYLQIKGNLIFPFIRKRGIHDDLVHRSTLLDQEIKHIVELSIMMHVDEPSGEYYHNMVSLLHLLDHVERVDSENIFPWMKEYLTEDDQHYISTHLKNQMVHESLPSSGLTVY